MANNIHNIKALANRICDEVADCLPTAFERKAARQALHQRVQSLLTEAGVGPQQAESRSVSILMADIRGFTALAETYSAVTLMELLNRYFSAMTEVIVEYGGTIDKFMGDAIMVLFGAPHIQDDDVERAIACGIAMQQAMTAFNEQNLALGLPELYMGIGINTGLVVAGSVGSEQHREYTVIGDEVNLVSRIEAQSLRGQVLISENTYQLAKKYIMAGEPNQVVVKGKRQPVTLYELLGTTRPVSMTVPRREIRRSPRVAVNMGCSFQRMQGKTVLQELHRAEIVDIGYNGLQVRTNVPLAMFSEVKLQVSPELFSSDSVEIYARVLHIEEAEQGLLCSLEFSSMGLAGQAAIKRFVDSQLYQS
jgi:adenylate cyclase